MDIKWIAKLKSEEEFLEAWEDEKYDDELRKDIFFNAISNNDKEARYKIVNHLLDSQYKVTGRNDEGETALHILLSRAKHNLEETYQLCERFIKEGVDINAVDCKKRLALQYLINMKYSDEDLEPFYNLWLNQENVCLEQKNAWGCSPVDIAKKMPYRKMFIEKIEKYKGNVK